MTRRIKWFAGALALSILCSISATADSWVYNPATDHYYALTPLSTWTNAEAFAAALGGHLVTINDAAEGLWLNDMFGGIPRQTDMEHQFWIGFTDQATEGTWLWISGETATYTNWYSGGGSSPGGHEPNEAVPGEDYALMGYFYNYSSDGWADVVNSGQYHGIVECSTAPVPEPATALILAGGLGCVILTRRMKKKREIEHVS